MRKAISFSAPILGAIIVAVAALFILSLEAGSGVGSGDSIAMREAISRTTATLETSKRFLATDLELSMHEASIQVAAAGGGLSGSRYWMAGVPPRPQVPSVEEVAFSLSNASLRTYNAYVDRAQDQLKELGVTASQSQCVGVDAPRAAMCPPKLSEGCESWGAASVDQRIRVQGIEIDGEDQSSTYLGNLAEEPNPNRFWWLYWNLKRMVEARVVEATVSSNLQASCGGGDEGSSALIVASIETACKKMGAEYLDEDVKLECTIKCLDESTSCLDENTEQAFNEDLCWAQGSVGRSFLLKITATDEKYLINQKDYVTWNLLYAADAFTNCEAVD